MKREGRCSTCYFDGKCISYGACTDYVPVIDEREDELLMKAVEKMRQEHYDAWLDYIADL